MLRKLEFRLQTVEVEQTDPATGEVWIQLDGGRLRGPRGETITRAEFDLICACLPFVLLLPDNGRDMPRP